MSSQEKVLDLIFGRWRSQILYAGVKLGIFDAVRTGSKKAAQLANELNLDPALTYRLLRALGSLELLREDKDRTFSLTETGELLRSDHPQTLRGVTLLEEGVSVSLGADGAACNNRLDMFTEMRTAALLQKALHGPEVLPASRTLRMATIDGAKAMGLDSEVGSLEVGKRADVAVVRLDCLHATPVTDVVSALVYSAEQGDVDTVLIDGELVMRERRLLTLDERETIESARAQREHLTADLGE